MRWLCIPTTEDRLVQRVLVSTVVALYREKLLTKNSFGSISRGDVEGESTATLLACNLRKNRPWCVKADISKFFDTIQRPDLVKRVRRLIRHRSLIPLVESAIANEVEASDPSLRKELADSGILKGVGVRQGMPLSPLLAHLYLVDFDRWAEKEGIEVVRYVDDLLILAANRDQALQHFSAVGKKLRDELDLRMHALGTPGKTFIAAPGQPVGFLGVEIYRAQSEYGRRIPGVAFTKLEERVSARLSVAPSDFEENYAQKAVSFIRNLEGAYKSAYGKMNNWSHFERHLRGQQIRGIKLFRKSITSIGKINNQVLCAFGVKSMT